MKSEGLWVDSRAQSSRHVPGRIDRMEHMRSLGDEDVSKTCFFVLVVRAFLEKPIGLATVARPYSDLHPYQLFELCPADTGQELVFVSLGPQLALREVSLNSRDPLDTLLRDVLHSFWNIIAIDSFCFSEGLLLVFITVLPDSPLGALDRYIHGIAAEKGGNALASRDQNQTTHSQNDRD
jgi:hypothetical protein